MHSTLFAALSLAFLFLASALPHSPPPAADKSINPRSEVPATERQELAPAVATSGWKTATLLPAPYPAFSVIARPPPLYTVIPGPNPEHIPLSWTPSTDFPSDSLIRTHAGKKTTFAHSPLDGRPDAILASIAAPDTPLEGPGVVEALESVKAHSVKARDTPREDHGAEEALARAMQVKDRLVAHELEVNDMAGHEVHEVEPRSEVKPFAPGPLLFLGKDGDWYTVGMMRASTVPGLAGMRFGPA